MCKRPCSNDDYLPTFNRPNVTLVDVSATKGVERHHREGHRRQRRRVRGRLHHLRQRLRDHHRAQPPLRHRRDRRAATASRSTTTGRDGYKTLHGMTTRGFPNQFFTGFTQGGIIGEHRGDLRAAGRAHRLHHRRGAEARRHHGRAQRRRRRTSGSRPFGRPRSTTRRSTPSARRATTTTKAAGAERASVSHLGEPYAPGFYAFERPAARVARQGRPGRVWSWAGELDATRHPC